MFLKNYKIDIDKSVYQLCKEEPKVKEILYEIGFVDIMKAGMLNTAGRVMTLRKGSLMKKIDLEDIKSTFHKYGYELTE